MGTVTSRAGLEPTLPPSVLTITWSKLLDAINLNMPPWAGAISPGEVRTLGYTRHRGIVILILTITNT